MSFRSKVIRLAYQNPPLRPHLLPLLKTAGAVWKDVKVNDLSKKDLDRVWDMYAISYRTLGLKAKNIDEIVNEYDHWELAYNSDGESVAFKVAKTTPFGLKTGFSGSDGSGEGKGAVKYQLSNFHKREGHYSEVSHAVEHIAVKSGAPAVCAIYAPKILRKEVIPSADGVHYTRNLQGIGSVEKMIVGRPRGIPVTDPRAPICPTSPELEGMRTSSKVSDDTLADLEAHFACLLFQG